MPRRIALRSAERRCPDEIATFATEPLIAEERRCMRDKAKPSTGRRARGAAAATQRQRSLTGRTYAYTCLTDVAQAWLERLRFGTQRPTVRLSVPSHQLARDQIRDLAAASFLRGAGLRVSA